MPTAEKTMVAPRYLSMSQTARRLGFSPSQLSEISREHPLYAPTYRSVPTGNDTPIGQRITRYHIAQVRTIERVLLGVIDLETGWMEWQIKRRELTSEEGA